MSVKVWDLFLERARRADFATTLHDVHIHEIGAQTYRALYIHGTNIDCESPLIALRYFHCCISRAVDAYGAVLLELKLGCTSNRFDLGIAL